MNSSKVHIVVLGESCFEGMAGTMRIRNLIDPLIINGLASASNLIYQRDIVSSLSPSGTIDSIGYKMIGYRISNPFSFIRYLREGKRYLKGIRKEENQNILLNYGGPSIVNIAFIRCAKRLGYKIVCDIVEDDRYENITHFAYWIKIKTSLYFLRRIWKIADVLTGISDHLFRRLKELSKAKIPVYHLPISVNLEKITNVPPQLDREEVRLFYGGSLTERDGLKYLIAAFDQVSEKYPQLKLVLSGAGMESDVKRLDLLISAAKRKDRIDYKGYLDVEEYRSLMLDCDILCMTRIDSRYANTGFPFKLGEYLASGKCIIATRVGDVPLYLSNMENAMLVEPGSVDEIVSAVSSILEDQSKAILMASMARQTAERFFSSGMLSEKFFTMIQNK